MPKKKNKKIRTRARVEHSGASFNGGVGGDDGGGDGGGSGGGGGGKGGECGGGGSHAHSQEVEGGGCP
ncbi:hypothetical protein M0802_005205 [Mischocyttarus mexicanus]|nr:hypothetical protein M0802_005205 [Mischocyttarus mexicanus]